MPNVTCYICGSGTGVCGPCRQRYFPMDPDASPPTSGAPVVNIPYPDIDVDIEDPSDPDDPYSGATADKEREAIKKAEDAGFTVVRAETDTLTLDLDGATSVIRYNSMIDMVAKKLGVEWVEWWPSKSHDSGNVTRLHVLVKLSRSMAAFARTALECALGSDEKRTVLNIKKIMNGQNLPGLLFMPSTSSAERLTRDFRIRV